MTDPTVPILKPDDSAERPTIGIGQQWLEIGLILFLFAAYAGQLPPDVNESHYLTKARHAWSPEWCPHDLFLDSASAHWLFFKLTGWWHAWLSLTGVAWVGRLLTWTFLAFAWQRVCRTLVSRNWISVAMAACFLLFNDRFHLAGEWVVGGFEAKGLAYGFVLLAISSLTDQRWQMVWIWLGCATALHALVGGWAWLALVLAIALMKTREGDFDRSRLLDGLRPWGIPLIGGIGLSLIGIVPPLLANRGLSSQEIELANWIYVNDRISHHLKFGAFPAAHVARFLGLVLAVQLLAANVRSQQPLIYRRWRWIWYLSLGSLCLSFAGLALSGFAEQGPWQANWSANWLRFYWFRLADFAVPMAAATGLTLLALPSGAAGNTTRIVARISVLIVLLGAVVVIGQRHTDLRPRADRVSLPTYPGDPDRTMATYRNWQKVCLWVSQNTRPDACFLTPTDQQTFKWYAGRTEVVNWKDIPQDARSIVAWRDRITELDTPQRRYELGLMSYSDDQLRQLAKKHGATHLLVPQGQVDLMLAPTGLKQVYPPDPSQKSTYVVFEF